MNRLAPLFLFLLAGCTVTEADAASSDALASAAPGIDESALDRSVDPCVDFHAFACGNWLASLPANTKRNVRGFTDLEAVRAETMRQTMRAIQAAPRDANERAAAAFVTSCLAEPDPAKVARAAEEARRSAESLAAPADVMRFLAHLHRDQAVAPFFTLVPGDTGRVGHPVASAGGYLGSSYETPNDLDGVREVHARFLRRIAPNLANADELAARTVDIERELYAATSEAPVEETTGRAALEAAAPHVDWASYFEALGGGDLGDFSVQDIAFFRKLDGVLGDPARLADVQAYLATYAIEELGSTVPPDEEPSREDGCMSLALDRLGTAFEPRFLELSGVDARTRAKARDVFDALVHTFDTELSKEPFLDDTTRSAARTKLRAMTAAVGASAEPDDLRALELDGNAPFPVVHVRVLEHLFDRALARANKPLPLENLGFMSAVNVNAAYDPLTNHVVVPAGVIGGFFFSESARPLDNMAGLGVLVAHELTHAFDVNGRHYDENGLERDWWTAAAAMAYETRAQCIVDEYAAVPRPQGHIDGERTAGENVADNGGLRLAYRTADLDGVPDVAGFSAKQQFFVAFAQTRCAKVAPDVAAQLLRVDPHAPGDVRVNLPLANFEAFADAFQCAAGAPMAPKNSCRVW